MNPARHELLQINGLAVHGQLEEKNGRRGLIGFKDAVEDRLYEKSERGLASSYYRHQEDGNGKARHVGPDEARETARLFHAQ